MATCATRKRRCVLSRRPRLGTEHAARRGACVRSFVECRSRRAVSWHTSSGGRSRRSHEQQRADTTCPHGRGAASCVGLVRREPVGATRGRAATGACAAVFQSGSAGIRREARWLFPGGEWRSAMMTVKGQADPVDRLDAAVDRRSSSASTSNSWAIFLKPWPRSARRARCRGRVRCSSCAGFGGCSLLILRQGSWPLLWSADGSCPELPWPHRGQDVPGFASPQPSQRALESPGGPTEVGSKLLCRVCHSFVSVS